MACDIMLGSLARHLRALGFDVVVFPFEGKIFHPSLGGRVLITRKKALGELFPKIVVLNSGTLKSQLKELKESIDLRIDPSQLFTRCLECNSLLIRADQDLYRGRIPEYIQLLHRGQVRYCETCDRFFWPGTHRRHMEKKFREWGLI